MRYPPAIIEQLKARLRIVDEVRKVVPQLTKKGRAWWGCCPFHNEKSASFHVREDQNSYYCFGCGAGGDVITFVQETQGGSFTETVQRLAQQVGLRLPEAEKTDPAAAKQRADGYAALARAAVFFQRNISAPAQAYLQKRQLSPATVEEFQLGYAPEGWSNLHDALLTEGFSAEILRQTGLTSSSEKGRGDFDRFRHRLMFPIHDVQARVVGFGGRVMGKETDTSGPKYLNSPETPFFNKSYLLYNLHRAKPHLKGGQPLVLVEGYMDVIALYQAGFKTAVAPLGTAVTEDQIALLWQQHPSPLVCLDGDAAGRNAALRVANRCLGGLEPGRTLQFVFLPQGEDPDSLIQHDGLAAFNSLLAQTTPLEAVLWQQLTAGIELTTADGRAAVENALSQLLANIPNQTVRKAYGQSLKDKIWQATRGTSPRKAAPATLTPGTMQAPSTYRPAVQENATLRTLLALVCRWPQALVQVAEPLGTLPLPSGPLTELRQALFRAYAGTLELTPQVAENLAEDLRTGPHGHVVTELLTSTGVSTLPPETNPAEQFLQHYRHYQASQQQRKEYTNLLKQADWFNPEMWNEYKNLKENVPTDLTPSPRRPI